MQADILTISILLGLMLFFFIIGISAVIYEKENKGKRNHDPNDWLFYDFDHKMYSAIFGYMNPDTVAEKMGIKIEPYYQQCNLVRKEPDMKRLVIWHVYGITALIVFSVLAIFSSVYFMVVGIILFFFFCYGEQQLLKRKAEDMRTQVSGELPRFLDLLQAELQIGMPIENAMLVICEKFPALISTEFLRAVNEMQMGASGWQKAMESVAERYDEETLSDFVLNVSTSYAKGVSIADTVTRKAKDVRNTHLLSVKEKAGKVTNTILLPMALFQLMPMIVFLIIPIMSELSVM